LKIQNPWAKIRLIIKAKKKKSFAQNHKTKSLKATAMPYNSRKRRVQEATRSL
jgi:hypothetical protein